jgi:hypothetical protein
MMDILTFLQLQQLLCTINGVLNEFEITLIGRIFSVGIIFIFQLLFLCVGKLFSD